MTYLKIKKYSNGKPILFGLSTMSTPYSVSVRKADVQADKDGYYTVPEGSFVVSIGGQARFLPRSRAHGLYSSNAFASATNNTVIALGSNSSNFKAGDVVYATSCFASVNVVGTIAQNDVFRLVINDVVYSVTAGASPTVTSVATAFVTDHAAALATAGVIITNSAGAITLWANDSYSIRSFVTSAAGSMTVQTTEPGFFGDNPTPLGTISSVSAVDPSTGRRTATLAANAALAVPANCPLGVRYEKALGIYPEPLDLTEELVRHIAPIKICDGVYEHNLPYVDLQLKRVFAELNINKRFYKPGF